MLDSQVISKQINSDHISPDYVEIADDAVAYHSDATSIGSEHDKIICDVVHVSKV